MKRDITRTSLTIIPASSVVAWSAIKKIAAITSCTASLIDSCVTPPKCRATHVNVRCKVTGVRTTISFWHPTVMWQTPQRPQCALTYTPVRSAVNKINLWKSRRKRQRPHKRWAYLCKTFKDCVDIEIHKCFMQPVGAEESSNALGLPVKRPCRSRAPRRASHALGLLDRNVSSVSYRRIGRKWTEPSYRPFSCTRITSAQRKSKNMSPSSFMLWVRITYLLFHPSIFMVVTVQRPFTTGCWPKVGHSRVLTVIFHNFKGCDGMFILKHLYDDWYDVRDQICVGAKIVSLKSGRLSEFHPFHPVLPLWW